MIYQYSTNGVCSTNIEIEISDDGRVSRVVFVGGCQGNLAGISQLAVGMTPEELTLKLKGIRCGAKTTSCPDQLAHALTEITRGENPER